MTRLQEQTAAYMKLQAEFDNYEWWEEGDGEEAASGGGGGEERRRGGGAGSRESLQARSRPATRPPTREEMHKFTEVAETAETEEYEEEEEDEEEEEEVVGQQVTVMVNGRTGGLTNGAPESYSSLPSALVPREEQDGEAEPEVPPRRSEKGEEQRSSWLDDGQST
jgi:hypothetical protein